ncbi:SLC13 family permease [Arsukibacterium sp.]|uniref:SLC13 family permease n=1 Tax=Arsukibacterium sp. TaxID=1977258 RepID=UPI00299EBD33|nr:SLC13 family permease [Arsukibacterium sp.]MDX1676412.1 SLC13 family permease [Arsukibacterium sp.]
MTVQQSIIILILLVTVAMFLWGRWRHDMVALGALLACVFTGLIEAETAFKGFGHPAVITVACVLVLSRALQSSGAVDVLTRSVLPAKAGPTVSIAALTVLAALLSGFMNNVGALALLMPVAIQLANRLKLSPGQVLMPLSFASILGGTTTLIGTPPNLIISGIRRSEGMQGFNMFDFTPVGASLTAVGLLFIIFIGWRLVPRRKQAGTEGFETGAYITEVKIPEGSKADGMKLREVEAVLDDADAQVVGLIRNDFRVNAPHSGRYLRALDILIIEAEADALTKVLSDLGLVLAHAKPKTESKTEEETKADSDGKTKETKDTDNDRQRSKDAKKANDKAQSVGASSADTTEDAAEIAKKIPEKERKSDEIVLLELAILPSSSLVNRSATDMLLRTRYSINLLAVSRHGRRSMARLRSMRLRAGDLLLMQGAPDVLQDFANSTGCVPLAERELRIPDKHNAIMATVIMVLAVALAALGILPAAVSFAAGVLASMALRTIPWRLVYESIDWPVVVLLACLLPVAGAMQNTGAAGLIASALLNTLAQGNAVIGLAVILITTLILTDLMNNAATAAVMAPIALGAANQLGVNPDTFLMAVAVGASCAFLTPIGHQNNTLILGPGGFRFGDYWRMGLPLDVLVVLVSLPVLLLVWPL